MLEFVLFIVLGAAFVAAAIGLVLVRTSGAQLAIGRRLAGAREIRVGDVLDLSDLPSRPLRVAGRIRCHDPIVTPRDDRLVALHRDVEVQLADGSWRTIERIRETRGFELWDHDGSLPLDAADAAEPLVTIPHVWRGRVEELADEAHLVAVERLRSEGSEPVAARATTRMVSVVERLLVLARISAGAGENAHPTLAPPQGGYLITTLDLPDAMRLLGGPRRRRLLTGSALLALAVVAAAVAVSALLLLR
jgi:hypothetical protein